MPRQRRLPLPEAAALFKLLGHENRLRLLLRLARGEASVGDLVGAVAEPQPLVSHHLLWLRLGRVVEARRAGKHVLYRLASPFVVELLGLVRGD